MMIYISGPMSGLKDNNRSAFRAVAVDLRNMGHKAHNPADYERTRSYREYLTMDMAWLGENADAMVMLPGWRLSPGATAEHSFAVALDLVIYFWPKDAGRLQMAKDPHAKRVL